MRTLIVSRGWQQRASIIPAPPPAVRGVSMICAMYMPRSRYQWGWLPQRRAFSGPDWSLILQKTWLC